MERGNNRGEAGVGAKRCSCNCGGTSCPPTSAGNYWPLQFIEVGLFTALAAVLLLLAVRQIRTHIA
jgi:hypothetical protein